MKSRKYMFLKLKKVAAGPWGRTLVLRRVNGLAPNEGRFQDFSTPTKPHIRFALRTVGFQ
jgi:hypothetical protein